MYTQALYISLKQHALQGGLPAVAAAGPAQPRRRPRAFPPRMLCLAACQLARSVQHASAHPQHYGRRRQYVATSTGCSAWQPRALAGRASSLGSSCAPSRRLAGAGLGEGAPPSFKPVRRSVRWTALRPRAPRLALT